MPPQAAAQGIAAVVACAFLSLFLPSLLEENSKNTTIHYHVPPKTIKFPTENNGYWNQDHFKNINPPVYNFPNNPVNSNKDIPSFSDNPSTSLVPFNEFDNGRYILVERGSTNNQVDNNILVLLGLVVLWMVIITILLIGLVFYIFRIVQANRKEELEKKEAQKKEAQKKEAQRKESNLTQNNDNILTTNGYLLNDSYYNKRIGYQSDEDYLQYKRREEELLRKQKLRSAEENRFRNIERREAATPKHSPTNNQWSIEFPQYPRFR